MSAILISNNKEFNETAFTEGFSRILRRGYSPTVEEKNGFLVGYARDFFPPTVDAHTDGNIFNTNTGPEGKHWVIKFYEEYLTLTRGRFGLIPLYYYQVKDGSIIIASEMKAFLGLKSRNIKQFAPGCFYKYSYDNKKLVKEPGEYELQEYSLYGSSPEEITAYLVELIDESLIYQIQDLKTTKIAVILGGIDSSVVAWQLAKLHSGLKFYCASVLKPKEEDNLDYYYSKKLCDKLGANLEVIIVTPDDVTEQNIKDAIDTYECYSRQGVANTILFTKLFKKINDDGFKFVFDGQFNDAINGTPSDLVSLAKKTSFKEAKYVGITQTDKPMDFLFYNKRHAQFGIQTRTPFIYSKYVDYCYSIKEQYIDGLDKPYFRNILLDEFGKDFIARTKGTPTKSANTNILSKLIDKSLVDTYYKSRFQEIT